MTKIVVTMSMDVDDDYTDNLKKLEHHIEHLVDVGNYPEIKSIYDVKVDIIKPKKKEPIKNKYRNLDIGR